MEKVIDKKSVSDEIEEQEKVQKQEQELFTEEEKAIIAEKRAVQKRIDEAEGVINAVLNKYGLALAVNGNSPLNNPQIILVPVN